MAIDGSLADRVRRLLEPIDGVVEKRMFGSLGFLVGGNLAVGVREDGLMVRVDPAAAPDLLREPGVRVFDATGRPMKGWLLVSGESLAGDGLARWVGAGVARAASLPRG